MTAEAVAAMGLRCRQVLQLRFCQSGARKALSGKALISFRCAFMAR